MSFNYGMRGKSPQQQAMVRQSEKAERIRKEESERKKEKEEKSLEYEFDYESVRSELSEKELSHFVDYVLGFKETIIQEVLRNKSLKVRDLETPLEVGDIGFGNNNLQPLYKTFQFSKVDDNVIKITKIT